jgi:hypothetical protein
MRPLYKTTIVVWSEYNPESTELEDLVRDAVRGDAYCSHQAAQLVQDPEKDEHWDRNTFFFSEEDALDDNLEDLLP